MPFRTISQKRWLRGLIASFGSLTQPPGSLTRLSNLLLTQRGTLITCDGSKLISSMAGSPQYPTSNFGPIIDFFLYQPIGSPSSYYLLLKDYNLHINPPTAFAAADGGAAGNLSAGTYNWILTALDGAGGETTASNVASVALAASHKADLTWTLPVPSTGTGVSPIATGFNLYRTKAGGVIYYLHPASPLTPGSLAAYTDNTADADLVTIQGTPAANTTQTVPLFKVPANSYGNGNIVKVFPADLLPVKGDVPGGYGGGQNIGGTTGNEPPTPAGGITNNVSPIPLIIQFANKMFLALGNGLTPYVSDGTTGGTTAITNTFTAKYPAWAASTGYLTGDQITATVGGVDYIFQCVQSGTSGTPGPPVWVATLNATVLDIAPSKIIWKNVGQVTTSPAPRGAAHAEYYAGSIWVANTAPDITSDQLDGPSALRMSDANNPNSWNPLNAAQISKDDGQQITGVKAFSVTGAGIAPTAFLTVFKDFSTYQIQGVFGASDFAIVQAQTDMGCIASRSIQFIPGYGLFRLTHLGIANFDGLSDRLISEEIRPYLFGGQDDISPLDWNYAWFAKGAQVAIPPMYCLAIPTTDQFFFPLAGVTVVQSGATVCTIPPGSYYCVVVKYKANGTAFESQEFGPITIDATHGFTLTLPTLGGGDLGYSFYYGTSSGQENMVINLATGGTTTLNTPGVSGAPASGGGILKRILCYDLVLKAWTIIDLPFPISVLRQIRATGTIPITIAGGFSDTALRRLQAGDPTWDSGATVAGAATTDVMWSLQSSNVYGEGGSQRVYYRRLVLRGSGSTSQLYLTPTYDGVDDTPILMAVQQFVGGTQFDARADILRTVEDFYATVQGTGVVELNALDHQIEPKPVGAAAKVFG